MHILQINSSIKSSQSHSSQLASCISDQLATRAAAGGAHVQLSVRDLRLTPAPLHDEAALVALGLEPQARSLAQQARVAENDALIAELQAADVLVLGVPMYNYHIPAQLKNWFDAIARAGVTFRYTEAGPQGLLHNKRVLAALTRGSLYQNGNQAMDHLTPWLRQMLAFLGLHEVEFFYAEGLGISPEMAQQSLAAARQEIHRRLS